MGSRYSYTPVGGKYFCLQGSLVSLASLLLLHAGPLHLETLGIRRKQLPGILRRIVRSRLNARRTLAGTLTLPAFGHLCLRTHRGYKVFDLSALTATKIFDHDVDEIVAAAEIAAVRRASPLDFAPTLLCTEPDKRGYAETFLPGQQSPKTGRSDPKDLFDRVIENHLCAMILLEPLPTTGLAEYWRTIRNALYERLEHANYDAGLRGAIHRFVGSVAARLDGAGNGPVQLAFTHGDFSFVNFISNKDKLAVIDWESAQVRSLFHDLYNYFLTELYYTRTESSLVAEINEGIQQLKQRLRARAPTPLALEGTSPDTYRWLYYLERMDMLTGRELAGPGLDVLGRSIEVFSRHEAAVSRPL